MRFLPTIENMMVERAPFLNIYVEFESLDNIGAIIGRIKEQNSQILDVEIDHGRGEGSGNPSAAFFSAAAQASAALGCAGFRVRTGLRLHGRGVLRRGESELCCLGLTACGM